MINWRRIQGHDRIELNGLIHKIKGLASNAGLEGHQLDTLEVGALRNETLGSYTCRARNGYHFCSTKKIQIGLQGKGNKPEGSVAQVLL